ncbi:SMI1/KNR4 family protein [Marivirga tractuosa]|uniref:SMI1/KNR4 family protein n=1 Tax=Marivirga tractuosa TaxID=1006 RepID=UPI0035D053DC
MNKLQENLIDKAYRMALQTDEKIHTGNPAEHTLIAEIEKELDTRFPLSYIHFLIKYGNLSFFGETFYGTTQKGMQATSAPSVLFVTKNNRALGQLSERMIAIKSSGYGPIFAIDMSEADQYGEGKIVEVALGYKITGEKKVLANSFAEFFYSEIENAIEDLNE